MASRVQEIADIAMAVLFGGVPLMLFALGYMTVLTSDTPAIARLGLVLLLASIVTGAGLFVFSFGLP